MFRKNNLAIFLLMSILVLFISFNNNYQSLRAEAQIAGNDFGIAQVATSAKITYYIDSVSGSYSNSGLDILSPIPSLKKIPEYKNIIISIKKGSVLEIDKNIFLEDVEINTFGNGDIKPVIVVSSSTAPSIIAKLGEVSIRDIILIGNDQTRDSSPGILALGDAKILLDNIEVSDYANALVIAGSNSRVSNSKFKNITNNAINLGDNRYTAPSNVIIESNHINIEGAMNDAITLHDGNGEGKSNIIRNNIIQGANRENAIDVLGQYSTTLIENNQIQDSGSYAITLSLTPNASAANSIITGNTFSNLKSAAIYSRSKNIVIKNNLFKNLSSNSLATAIAISNDATIKDNNIFVNSTSSRPVISFLEEASGGGYVVNIFGNNIVNKSPQMIYWYNGSGKDLFLNNFNSYNNVYTEIGSNSLPFMGKSYAEWTQTFEGSKFQNIESPTVVLSPVSASVKEGDSLILTWNSSSSITSTCTASGAWSGNKESAGSQSVTPTSTGLYILTCTNAVGSSSMTSSVIVNSATKIIPVNASCGTSNTQSFTTAPTTNLCNTGSASTLSGTGPWSWSCTGSNGGTSASCSASLTINNNPTPVLATSGKCGLSNGGSFSTSPSSNLCNSGTPSMVYNSGYWNWTCMGTNGVIESCAAGIPGQPVKAVLPLTPTTSITPTTKTKIYNCGKSVPKIKYSLAYGSKGTDVLALQCRLLSRGYLSKTDMTGIYYTKTVKAVQAFQCDNSIVCNTKSIGYGRVGIFTRGVLNR